LVQKVVTRDSFNYRKLTDEAVVEEGEEVTPTVELEIDVEKLASGMCTHLVGKG